MSIITTVKDKILKNCILARILPPARIQGQKVVLARKIEKQGLGSTPAANMPDAAEEADQRFPGEIISIRPRLKGEARKV